MSAFAAARYNFNVHLLGNGLIRWFRIKSERQMRRPGSWTHEHLAPPLSSSPRLKELIARHYLRGRYANGHRKVAWITSGAPVEALIALDYYVLYPENHAAVCGIRRQTEAIASRAEDAGYSRDICSYARTDIGSVLSGETPVGRLPRPDLLVCCTNICQTVLYWYRVLAAHFDVPLAIIDTPFLYGEAKPHDVDYVRQQIEQSVELAERIAGRSLDDKKLKTILRYSKQAVDLWAEILARGRNKPAPLTAFDEFIHMAPIVEMRGEAYSVDYYAMLLAELDARIEQGIGAVRNETKRILWDNLPVWNRIRWLAELLAERGVAMVASTYTNAWAELAEHFNPEDPIGTAATVHLHALLNRGTGHKLELMAQMVEDYDADGVILHSDRSCKPYSIGQLQQRDQLGEKFGVPALLLEADHSDPRSFSEEQAENRLSAFMEILGV